MKKVLLINCSAPSYNLGMEKAKRWLERMGVEVRYAKSLEEPMWMREWDEVWLSAIFSWDVRKMVRMAREAMELGVKVEVGGPGTFGVKFWIMRELGLVSQSRPDLRFEREPGEYAYVFWSRGCPAKNCTLGYPKDGSVPVCSVPEMEGSRYTLYTDVEPARVIADNNLSALPRAHQELIVERTLGKGFASVDANSGFEPHSMRPWVVDLWKRLPLVCWRFAYDEVGEKRKVEETLRMLGDAGVKPWRCHIYCLAGNEPVEQCEERVRDIVKWKAYPIVQRRRPLDWLSKEDPLPCLFDWTERKLMDFQRWGNRLARGGMEFGKYDPKLRGERYLLESLND